MPDVENDGGRRNGRLPTQLFWAGVGLAPLAALLMLLGGSGTLRVGAVLGLLAVVLIGLSVALRPDAQAIRLQIEETLLEEIDVARAELRDEIGSSARTTHQMVGERLGAVQQSMESLRAQRQPPAIVAPMAMQARAAVAIPATAAPPPPISAPGYINHPVSAPGYLAPPPVSAPGYQAGRPAAMPRSEPPPAAPTSGYAAPANGYPAAPTSGYAGPANGYPAAPANGHAAPANGAANGAEGGRVQPPAGRGRRSAEARPDDAARAGRHQQPAERRSGGPGAAGVYRRTETVVTTRSTYVDGHVRNGDRNGSDSGGHRSQEWSSVEPRSAAPRSRADEAFEESWTDQQLRARYGRRSRAEERGGSRDDEGWRSDSGQWPISGTPERRTGGWQDNEPAGQPGERWAEVSADDRGSELRLGERRSSRRSDEHGSEVRIEDRWAAVRREAGRGGPDRYRDDGQPDTSRRALPSSSSEPSWNDAWEEPVRQSRGRRQRDDEGGRGGRRFDFEVTDERWR